jgi:hypothetical protein
LLTAELRLADADARPVIIAATSAARRCVVAQNQQLLRIEQARAQMKIRASCLRVVNCIKRAPAPLRKRLNREVLSTVEADVTDLEVLESILDVVRSTFAEFLPKEPAESGLDALGGVHFSAIAPTSQSKVQQTVAEFRAAAGKRSSANLFIALAAVLDGDKVPRISEQVGEHITRYVGEVAKIWRKAGLKPSVTHDYLHQDPSTYRSKFHRFADLILKGVMGSPRGRLHDAKPSYDASVKPKKHSWIVSYSHLKKALRVDSNLASKNVL